MPEMRKETTYFCTVNFYCVYRIKLYEKNIKQLAHLERLSYDAPGQVIE